MLQFPRLVAPSTWGELDRAPLTAQFPRLLAVSSERRSRPGSPALSGPSGVRRICGDGGFCSIRSLTTACRRRVAPLMLQFPRLVAPSTWGELDRAPLTAQFPPFGGGEFAVRGGEFAVRGGEVTVWGTEVEVRGGEAPKVQTTSATNADNGVSWARWSTFWAKLSRTWCVVRTRTAEYAR